jgi:cation transport regulator ChaB
MATDVENSDRTVVPRPDPTVLTTQQLLREIATVRELLESRVEGLEKIVDRQHVFLDKLPSQIEHAVGRLQELHDEKFESIQTQFRERDTRTEQTSKDSKVAVDAALQAAKEAVGAQQTANASSIDKSEKATSKQIDSIVSLLQTTTVGTNDKIDGLKSIMASFEVRLTAAEANKKGSSEGISMIGLIVVGAFGVLGVLISLGSLIFVMNHNWK